MSYYVEIEVHVYDQGPMTTGVGHYLSQDKARTAAANIDARLRRGTAKAALVRSTASLATRCPWSRCACGPHPRPLRN